MMTALAGWESYYVIVGSSAGALIGLQFVVLTLIADRPIRQGEARAGAAFATPTLVHFAAVLVVSAVLSAPWEHVAAAASIWGAVGVAGIAYSLLVARRMRVQTIYRPVFEDWLCYALIPLASYGLLGAAAAFAGSSTRGALFSVAAAALLLLLVGIHNAWDTVVYNVFVKGREATEDKAEERGP